MIHEWIPGRRSIRFRLLVCTMQPMGRTLREDKPTKSRKAPVLGVDSIASPPRTSGTVRWPSPPVGGRWRARCAAGTLGTVL